MGAFWLGLANQLCGCAGFSARPGPGSLTAPVSRATVQRRVSEYFRRSAGLPGSTELTLIELAPAPVSGWQKGVLDVSLNGQSQRVEFLVSDDGRYLLRGEIADLTHDPIQANLAKISLAGQPTRGSPSASITVVEFSDFQCQFCAQASRTVGGALLAAYPKEVKVVHKNLPLTQIHDWAEDAAVAGECAYRQGNDAFWEVYEELFQHQDSISSTNLREVAGQAAKRADADLRAFNDCFDRKETIDEVRRDQAEATALKVNSTPTFFINGRRLSGVQPIEGFTAIIDEELGRE